MTNGQRTRLALVWSAMKSAIDGSVSPRSDRFFRPAINALSCLTAISEIATGSLAPVAPISMILRTSRLVAIHQVEQAQSTDKGQVENFPLCRLFWSKRVASSP